MPTVLELTWAQFNEIRKLLETIHHAKEVGASEGELKNTVVDGEWSTTEVKLTID